MEAIEVTLARTQEQLTAISSQVERMGKQLEQMAQKLDNHYVTQEEFKPVKSIVFGMVTLIMTLVITALIALVVHTPR